MVLLLVFMQLMRDLFAIAKFLSIQSALYATTFLPIISAYYLYIVNVLFELLSFSIFLNSQSVDFATPIFQKDLT